MMEGVTAPEEKRVKIGNEFVATFERELKRIGHHDFLAQARSIPTSSNQVRARPPD